jgi:hypothetical protein
MQSHSRPLPPPNPIHQRQVFWQVWLPLVVFLIVFVGLCVLAVLLTSKGNAVATQWAALSVIIVLIPACLGGIFNFLFLAVGIFISDRAIRGLPGLTYEVQLFFRKLSAIIRYYADRIVSPVISIIGKWAGLASLFKFKPKISRDK